MGTHFMKAFSLMTFLALSYTAPAQTWNLDKGEGDTEDLRTAFTALDLLERNDPVELLHYFAAGHRPDSVLLHSWIAHIQALHPTLKNDGVSPCFCNYAGKGLWYERTYFSMADRSPKRNTCYRCTSTWRRSMASSG